MFWGTMHGPLLGTGYMPKKGDLGTLSYIAVLQLKHSFPFIFWGVDRNHSQAQSHLCSPPGSPEWVHSPFRRANFPNAPNSNSLQGGIQCAPRNQHPLPHTPCSGSGHTPCIPHAWDSSGARWCSQQCPMAPSGSLLGIAFEGG